MTSWMLGCNRRQQYPATFPREKHAAAGLTCKPKLGAANINEVVSNTLLHLRTFLA